MKDYRYYKECFSALHTAKSKGFFAPHKPLLLLSVIELFNLLQDEDVRAKLRVALISKYFTSQPSSISPLAILPACITLISLIA